MASSTPSLKRLPPSYEDVCRKRARKSPTKPDISHSHGDAVFNQATTVHNDASTPPQTVVHNPEVVTSTSYTRNGKTTFFSLPPEIRNIIYEYLVPIRVHISPPSAEMIHIKAFNPWSLASIAERSPPKPWTLASVSRQFRAELRSIAYPRTQIDIQSDHRDAYKTWIKGLDENLAASIYHLRIDDWIEIDRMPENAIAEFEWGYGFFRLLRTENRYCRQTVGKWEIAWLRYIEYDDFSRLEFMEQTVDNMKDRLESSAAMAGLGEQNIRDLVKSHRRCIRKPLLTSQCCGALPPP
ncbi:MAG: hypothetical protein Q9204_003585 [Flavoplaca sp. TL-2023a]